MRWGDRGRMRAEVEMVWGAWVEGWGGVLDLRGQIPEGKGLC